MKKMLDTKFKFYVSNNYIELLQSEKYESILLSILTDSKKIFTGKYTHIEVNKQSNGESDFIEEKNKAKRNMDSKVLFYTQMCTYIAKNNIECFVDEFTKEYNEIFDCINAPDYYKAIEGTILYQEIVNILKNKIKKDEDLIMFLPFPFSRKFRESYVANCWLDNIEMVNNQIKNNYLELLGDRHVYLITNNIGNQTVIYDLSNNPDCKYEIIDNNYIKEYINVIGLEP